MNEGGKKEKEGFEDWILKKIVGNFDNKTFDTSSNILKRLIFTKFV